MNPVATRVQDGTTFGGTPICARPAGLRSDASARSTASTGLRCGALQGQPIVPTKIARCTAYIEKGRMTLGEMIDTAWIVEERGKKIGFLSPEDMARRRGNNPDCPAPPHGF